MLYVGIYAVAVNILGFIVMGFDKWKAKNNRRRISERDLITMAAIGGAIGVELGMRHFHHKTLNSKFVFGVPLLIITNLILYGYVIYVISRS
ncbi:MAG: DUF1294 domain-containing protein [Bacillota bacterium]